MPTTGVTALQAIRDAAHVEPGQHVAVIGASGGVGTFTVQIAKAYGAEVTAVAGARNVDLVRSIGADHVVDYAIDDIATHTGRYDVIIDLVGNQPLRALRRALTLIGTFVVVGGQNPRSITGMQRFATAAAVSPVHAPTPRAAVLETQPRRPRLPGRTRRRRCATPHRRAHLRPQRHRRGHPPHRDRARHRPNRHHHLTSNQPGKKEEPTMPTDTRNPLSQLDPNNVHGSWSRLGFEQMSDSDLLRAATELLVVPHREPADSFTLHAPLELMARAQMLPAVSQDRREAARQRIAHIAATWATTGTPATTEEAKPVEKPLDALAGALRDGDPAAVDRAFIALCAHRTQDEIIGDLADVVLPHLGGAAHGAIFLELLPRFRPIGVNPALMARTLLGDLARHPDRQLSWFTRPRPERGRATSP